MEKIPECCENLDKKIESFKLQKSKANNGLNEDRIIDTRHIKMRDEILCELNSLWNVFSCAESKQCINSAAYVDLFQIASKENGGLLKVLMKCLNCDDHFIAFQCHKLLIEVYKCFPNLVLGALFDQLIGLSLSDLNCGRWLSIYTAEILKALFLQLDCLNVSNFYKKSFKCQHVLSDEKEKQIGTKDILDCLNYHWLKMTNKFLVELSARVLKQSTSLPEDAQESRFDTFQEILVTMLSCGKTFMQSCDFLLANPAIPTISVWKTAVKCVGGDLPKSDECLKKSKRAKIYENESVTISKVCPSCHMCKKGIFKDDDNFGCFSSDVVSCTMECKLKLFEKITRQLVALDHKRCFLHLSRTIFQFLNDVVSSILDQCFNSENKGISSQDGILKATGVCSVLVENVNMILGNIPHVNGKANFGGQNCRCGQEESNICGPLYDDICLRKVLLLVLKSILVNFHVQSGHIKEMEWQALKEPLHCWLRFVTRTSHSDANLAVAWLVQLFCDQDDELVCLLFCLLQLYQWLFCGKSSQSVPVWANHLCNSLNPHGFFMEFLSSVSYDDSLLLDFLISNETHFLQYFFNYLRYMANDWYGFLETVDQRIRINKHKDLLQSSGTEQVPKERDLGMVNCSSCQLCRTSFSGGRSSNEDGDNVYGSLDYGNDCGCGDFSDGGCNEAGNSFSNGDEDCDDSGSYGVDGHGDGALGFNFGGHGSDDYGDDDHGDDDHRDDDHGDDDHRDDDHRGDDHGDDDHRDDDHGDDDHGNDDHGDDHRDDDHGDDDHGDDDHRDDDYVDDDHIDDDHRDDDHGDHRDDDHRDDDHGDDGSDGGDSNDQDGGSGDDFSGSHDCCDNSYHHDHGATSNESHNNCGDCSTDLSDKHAISDSDVDDHGENKPKTCYDGNASSQMPFCRSSDLEQILSCLIRLRFAIERMASKRLFPYPVTALLKVMKYVETLYEGETLQ